MLTTTDPSGRPSAHAGRQSRNGWPTLVGSVLHGGWDALDDSENRIRSKGDAPAGKGGARLDVWISSGDLVLPGRSSRSVLGTPGKSQRVPSCEGGSGARTTAASAKRLGVFNLPGMLSEC